VVDFASQIEKQQYGKQFLLNSNLQQSDLIKRLGSLLDLVMRNKDNHFADLKGGPSLLAADSVLTFSCFSPSSGVTATIPVKRSPHVSFDLFDGSKNEALKIFERTIEAIKEYYGTNLTRVSKSDYSDRQQSIYFYLKNPETNRTYHMNLVATLRDSQSDVRLEDYP
jgi:hypothetical protein